MGNIIRNTAGFAVSIVSQYVQEGDTVVDATCGNGHDTLALAQMVGAEGKVYGFDISGIAVMNTMKLLEDNDVQAEIELIYDGHEDMDMFIETEVSAIVFNLGYLPGEDKDETTKTETTMTALEKAIGMIKVDGVVSAVLYPGHDEGRRERDAVLSWAAELDKGKYHSAHIKMVNQLETAPEILLVTRKK